MHRAAALQPCGVRHSVGLLRPITSRRYAWLSLDARRAANQSSTESSATAGGMARHRLELAVHALVRPKRASRWPPLPLPPPPASAG